MPDKFAISESQNYRKRPQQERARATVDSILQATMQLAESGGFRTLSTRRIAEAAGVSIGSLYQYFPTVEAILLSIYEETASRVVSSFRAQMLSVMHLPMEIVGQKTLELLLKEYEEHQLILHTMVTEMPQIILAPGVASLDNLLRTGIRVYFQQFGKFAERDIERVSFFLEIVVVGSLKNYLSNRPRDLTKEEFLNDLKRVAISYVESQNWQIPK